jgi:hypothetical protein
VQSAERELADERLDEALRHTFPASDPLSITQNVLAVASWIRFDAGTFTGELPLVAHPGDFELTLHDSTLPTGKRIVLFRIQHVAAPLLGS